MSSFTSLRFIAAAVAVYARQTGRDRTMFHSGEKTAHEDVTARAGRIPASPAPPRRPVQRPALRG